MSNRTSVQYGDFIVRHKDAQSRDGVQLQSFSNLLQINLDNVDTEPFMDQLLVYQKQITHRDLLQGLHLKKQLGQGGHGTAYLSVFIYDGKMRECVAKFSNFMFESKILQINGDNVVFTSLDSRLKVLAYEQGIREMKVESKNAVSILTPYYVSLHGSHTGYRLKKLNLRDFKPLQKEALRIRAHPGFVHLHRILHFDETLGCIVSEYCTGTLIDVLTFNREYIRKNRSNADDDDILAKIERSFCGSLIYQMALAIHYLLHVAKIAHLDIKYDNIFYQQDANKRFTWKLGDFGICENLSPDIQHKTRPVFIGHSFWHPLSVIKQKNSGKPATFDAAKCMVHSYAMSMVQALSFHYVYHGLNSELNANNVNMEEFYIQHFLRYPHFNLVQRFSTKFSFLKTIVDQSLSTHSDYFDINDTVLLDVFDTSVEHMQKLVGKGTSK